MDFLHQLDNSLFTFINGQWHSDFSDLVLPLLREKTNWIPFYLVLVFIIFRILKKKAWIVLLAGGLCVGTADFVSSEIIKPHFQRDRPCNDLNFKDNVRLLVPCGSGFSFPSSHSSNHFGLAFFLIFLFGKRQKRIIFPLIIWAFSIAYAQVYVGVHYPSDISAGAILGIILGWLYARIPLLTIDRSYFLPGSS